MSVTGRRPRSLVAGGAGFIGSHLCSALVQRGHDVICLDDFSTGSRHRLAAIRDQITVIQGDVIQPRTIEVDYIYNLASPAAPEVYQRDPIRTIRTNVLGTLNLLELAERCGATLLLASTSEVYGDPDVHPQPESYRGSVSCTGPRACYDESKRCAEAAVFDFIRTARARGRVARIFNTYGPGMDPADGRVIFRFLEQAKAGAPITIYGDGAQTRSFCYVSDTVAGLVRLMESTVGHTGPVNIGNPEEHAILDVAQIIRELVGSGSSLVFRPLPADDPQRRRPDVSRARELLGWSPTISLRDGLTRIVAEYGPIQGQTLSPRSDGRARVS